MQIVLYSTTDTFSIDSRDVNFKFFILAAHGSSVIAYHQPDGVRVPLKDAKDSRLKKSYWGLLKLPPLQDSEIDMHTWSFRRDCDDFIRVIGKDTTISGYRLLQRQSRG